MTNSTTNPTPAPSPARAPAHVSAMALFRLVFDTVAVVMGSVLAHLRTQPIPTTCKTFRQVAHCLYSLARVELSMRLIPQRITPVQVSRLALAMRQFSALTGKIFNFVPFMPETSDDVIQDYLDAQALFPPKTQTSPSPSPLGPRTSSSATPNQPPTPSPSPSPASPSNSSPIPHSAFRTSAIFSTPAIHIPKFLNPQSAIRNLQSSISSNPQSSIRNSISSPTPPTFPPPRSFPIPAPPSPG